MYKILNKYKNLILNLFLGLFTLSILFIITFVNIENIFQFNLNDTYTLLYFIFLILSVFLLFGFRYIYIYNNILKQEINYTVKSIFFITLFIIPSTFFVHYFILENINETGLYLRAYGKVSFLFFAFTLIISPIAFFIKNNIYRENLFLIRKIFGILSFVFFLKHGLEYFGSEYIFQQKYSPDMSYLGYVYKNLIVWKDALTGVIAGVLMLLLGITSNKISLFFLGGRKWKFLQSIVYPAFLLSAIHIAYASRFDNFYIFLILLVVFIRAFAYFSGEKPKKNKKTSKYICIPCSYIYDENIGDPDSGIEPGTKFEEIPDDWVCPICGVTKVDFEPYYEEDSTIFGGNIGKIVSYNMLTLDVLKIGLLVEGKLNVLPGQYAIVILKDFDGEFKRSYSVVDYKDGIITFAIKIKDTGRGGRTLKTLKESDIIKIQGVYGDFVLKNTTNPKVFISTGTGISPIINMLQNDVSIAERHLFFGVQREKDLFFKDEIKKLKNVNISICLSKEEKEGYSFGRIDITKYDFEKNSEFYICGNEGMIISTIKILKQGGYTNIYSEKF